jgi:peptidoglycan/xylan/chitin deacetylase (PgdA/CDA1 family)
MNRTMVRLAKRVVMLAISLVYAAGRAVFRVFAGRSGCAGNIVLTYHAVSENDMKRLDRQMAILARLTTPVFADATMVSNGRPHVAVTFDDAFQHVFDRALPVLRNYGVPATIFVPTGYLGAEPGWAMARLHGQRPGPVVSIESLRGTDGGRVRIGSHSVTHPRLASVDRSRLHDELSHSRRQLEEIVGYPVRLLALPYGSCNAQVIAAASETGYDTVYANVPIRSGSDAPSLVGRVDVSPCDWPLEFRLKIHGAYEWMAMGIPAKRYLVNLAKHRAS